MPNQYTKKRTPGKGEAQSQEAGDAIREDQARAAEEAAREAQAAEEAAREAQAAEDAAREAQAKRDREIRTHFRVKVYRLDGTADETVSSLPKVKRGETVTFTLTPEQDEHGS